MAGWARSTHRGIPPGPPDVAERLDRLTPHEYAPTWRDHHQPGLP